MTHIVDRDQIRAYDRHAIAECAVPGVVLMENAGRGAAERIAALCEAEPRVPLGGLPAAPVLVVCGPGNNGGDGFVVGRHLLARGFAVEVLLVGEPARVRGDARTNLDAFVGVGGRLGLIQASADLAALEQAVSRARLVVDALFGTGLDRPITGLPAEAVAALNRALSPVVALDIPSGIDANRGQVLGVAVRASHTITFAHPKLGLLTGPGVEHAGRLDVVGLGLPDEAIIAAVGHAAETIERPHVARVLGSRPTNAHKYQSGSLLVVAGRPGKVGAALLAGRAALRAGAGIVAIASWPAAADAIDMQAGELMSVRIEPDRIGVSLDDALARRGAVAIGPGLGLGGEAREVVERVVLDFPGPVVVDADAITQLRGRSALLRDAPAARVLTPHSGELARLLGTSASEIESDRFGWASRAAEETGQVVVLKGRNTIVAAAGRTPFVCTRGSAVLATAGSGDVLTGIMGALLCVAGPLDAACAAVWLHAAAADQWSGRHRADRGLIARDLIAELPDAIAAARAG